MTSIEFGYTPLPSHRPFHQSRKRHAAMVGALGSGKSTALMAEAVAFALENPGARMLLSRMYQPRIRDTIVPALEEVMPHDLWKSSKRLKANGGLASLELPNHSIVLFRGLTDWTAHKSTEYAWIGIDEVDEHPTDTHVRGLVTRVRQRHPRKAAVAAGLAAPGTVLPNRCRYASNPAGKNWVWKAFFSDDRWDDAEGFVSRTLDNPYLPPDYVRELLSRPPQFVRQYVMGEFLDGAGLVYPDWSPDTHIVPRPTGEAQVMWMAADPGLVSETAAVWAVVDQAAGRLVCVAEDSEPDRRAALNAAAWRRVEGRLAPWRVTRRFSDPSLAKRDPATNMQLADVYRRLGFSFTPSPNTHKVRVPALQNAITSGALVVTEDCPRLFAQINKARWKDQVPSRLGEGPHRPEVVKGEDDLHDCAQYLATWHVAARGAAAAPQQSRMAPADEVRAFREDRARAIVRQTSRPRRKA